MSFITTKINDCLYEFTELSKFTEDEALMPYVDAYLLIGEERAVLIDALNIHRGFIRRSANIRICHWTF